MKTITVAESKTKDKAQIICSLWHGGQWSALYQFASSGLFHYPNVLRYLQEIETCLHPEYALHPQILSKKDSTQLTWLKSFFIQLATANGYNIEFKEHSTYGYYIPYLTNTQGKEAELKNIINLLYFN